MINVKHEQTAADSAARPIPTPLHVLILEDNPRDVELCVQELNKAGFELMVDAVDTEQGFAAKLQSRAYDLILADNSIPNWTGVEAFHILKQSRKNIPFIFVTGTMGEEAAVDLIKEGVADYILKDRLIRLPSAVHRALQEKNTQEERERAIQSLRESEERIRLLLDSAAEGICGTDVEGICTFCNAASLRLLGYDDSSELVGKQMHWLIHHTRADGTQYPIEDCKISMGFREGKGSHADDDVLWRKDHTSFPVEWWSYPVVKNEIPIGSVVTFLDITERKQVEQLKDDFLSHISHELRTPLTAIYQFGTLIADGSVGKTSQEQDEFLQIMLKNVGQLRFMINDLIEITQAQTVKFKVELQSASLFEAIVYAVHLRRGAAVAKGITLSCDPSAQLPSAHADPERLRQILLILIDNAIKFTATSGAVEVHAQLFEKDPGFLLVEVCDTGCGISPEATEHIFERLYQATVTDTAGRSGMGLGLYIAKELVTRQGGRIWVNDEPQKGSHFFFTVPVSNPTIGLAPTHFIRDTATATDE
jgi:PAS domain S-box-containing protein